MQTERTTTVKWIPALGCFLLCLAVTATAAEASSEAWTIVPPQRVAAAISAAGPQILAGQVEFLGEVRATPGAQFSIVGVENRTHDAARVKLRCQSSHDCLPFYVVLHGADAGSLARAAQAAPLPGANRPAQKQRVIKGGDPATLVLQGSVMQIVMPVICLQNGVRGQTIRVSSTDHKKIYEAEVVETGLLKGSL